MTSMWGELLRMIGLTISMFDTPTPIKKYETLVSLADSFNASRTWATQMHPKLSASLPALIDIQTELDAQQPRLDHMAIMARYKNLSAVLHATSS